MNIYKSISLSVILITLIFFGCEPGVNNASGTITPFVPSIPVDRSEIGISVNYEETEIYQVQYNNMGQSSFWAMILEDSMLIHYGHNPVPAGSCLTNFGMIMTLDGTDEGFYFTETNAWIIYTDAMNRTYYSIAGGTVQITFAEGNRAYILGSFSVDLERIIGPDESEYIHIDAGFYVKNGSNSL